MKKALVCAWLLFVVSAASAGWPVEKVLRSVVRLSIVDVKGVDGHCTGFVIARGVVMTAAHCANPDDKVTINDVVLDVIAADAVEDVAVLSRAPESLEPLRLGSRPEKGESILAIGFAMSTPKPLFFEGLYQGVFDPWNQEEDRTILSTGIVKGMSGGPFINRRGEVVSVAIGTGHPAQSYQNVGYGARWEAVRRMWLTATK